MRKHLLLLIAIVSFTLSSSAQNFSNQGKEFYLCYPNHVANGTATPSSVLSIWITSDQASSGTVTMPGGVFSATFNIIANGIQEINVPYSVAHITGAQSNQVIQKSIKISVNAGQPPVVAYAQQYGTARSASDRKSVV